MNPGFEWLHCVQDNEIDSSIHHLKRNTTNKNLGHQYNTSFLKNGDTQKLHSDSGVNRTSLYNMINSTTGKNRLDPFKRKMIGHTFNKDFILLKA